MTLMMKPLSITFSTAHISSMNDGPWRKNIGTIRSSHPEVFLRKCVLKIYSKFTGEHPCRSAISTKLQSNFIEIALQHVCAPVNVLHIFRKPFSKNISGRLLLKYELNFLSRNEDTLTHLFNKRYK